MLDSQSECVTTRPLACVVSRSMENRIFINTTSHLRLLLTVLAICFLGLTGCSSLDAEAPKGLDTALMGNHLHTRL
jgi:hypothetical protein